MPLREIRFAASGIRSSFIMDDADGTDFVVGLAESDLARYEEPLPAMLAAFATTLGTDFLDVGANTGIYSLHYAASAPRAAIYAFEPLPRVAEALLGNIRLNPLSAGRITVERVALSDKAGSGSFYETINDRGFLSTSSTLEEAHAKGVGEYRELQVPTRRLDDYVGERQIRAGVIKIDVEGHELSVLRGAAETIRNHRPVLVVELLGSADTSKYREWLRENSYFAFALMPRSLVFLGYDVIVPSARNGFEILNHVLCPIESQIAVAKAAQRVELSLG